MSDMAVYEREVMSAVRRRLRAVLEQADRHDVDAETLTPPDRAAEAMVAAMPGAHPVDAIAGPFYDTAGLTEWLGVSRQAINKQVRGRRLLGCTTADGALVYPAWQFAPSGVPIDGLPDVLAALFSGTDDAWTVALWLRAPNADLGSATPADWLAGGGSAEVVTRSATASAARWR